MKISKKNCLVTRIVAVTCLALLLLLTGFESLPLSHYATDYLNGANIQCVRSQVLVKSALTLEYRPAAEHAQAISDMQVVLPLFIAEQDTLARNHNADLQQAVQFAHGDFLALVSAAQNIINQAKSNAKIDQTQVNILIMHNRGYLTAQNEIVAVIVAHEEADQGYLFSVEVVFDAFLLLLIGGLLIHFEIAAKRQKHKAEQETV